MGIWSRLTRRTEPVTESVKPVTTTPAADPTPAQAARRGYEYGIPRGGTTEYNQGGGDLGSDRRELLEQLYQVYTTCTWASACVDAIARTVTAGGLYIDWAQDDQEGDRKAPARPPEVQRLQQLIDYCNPYEDMQQLLRGLVTDLQVAGDAYLEVVWFLGEPIALYSLDAASMRIISDPHGVVTQYVQITDDGQRAPFEPDEIIHISMDTPRSGLHGTSATERALLPITTWLYASGLLKETHRKGDPPMLHVDFPESTSDNAIKRWLQQFRVRVLGPKNRGEPIITTGGGKVTELQPSRIPDLHASKDQARDEILAVYGVPPAQVGVIESGNLGGGTGDSQRKTFMTNTCAPVAALILEKLNFHLTRRGFGIDGWTLKLREVDMRDSLVIEQIRDLRIRNGLWLLNRGRADIGEPPVKGGDDAVLIDRQNLVLWADIATMSKAMLAKTAAPGLSAGAQIDGIEMKPEPEPASVPPELAVHAAAMAAGQQPPAPGQPPAPPGSRPAEAYDWRTYYEDDPDEEDEEDEPNDFAARLRAALAA
ncbi:phage portal protein BeeE [Kitasatospora sp. GP30]|uniref:phage portal protein n=1 Tax=Kitasatospora sp. GP30 TaxID=3035084 RepID=UPI000CC2CA08|nr:phage portal protein [Kitasatospora sp. GP30]MDH6141149.1 phage portal protein BeeE [Kitasatospora sp. GP30]